MKAATSRDSSNGQHGSPPVASPSVQTSEETETSRPLPAKTPDSKTFGLRDLELMHKFSTETYRSLCTEASDHYTWQVILPQKALDHPFLLNGILALGALHIASTLNQPTALSYIDTALQYHNMAFAPYRHAIDNLTPDNCDAAFGHAIITTVIGIALPRLTAARDGSSNMTENIVVVVELLKGVSKILSIARPWMKTRLFSYRTAFFNVDPTKIDKETDAAITRLANLNDDTVSRIDADHHPVNKDAISKLHKCFCRYADNGDAGSVLGWLAAVDKVFVHCLRSRHVVPVLILLHWAVLLDQLDGQIWWARNSGKALVSELLAILPSGNTPWEEAKLWPKQKCGL